MENKNDPTLDACLTFIDHINLVTQKPIGFVIQLPLMMPRNPTLSLENKLLFICEMKMPAMPETSP